MIEKIDAIGTVTLDSKAAIEAARTAYDALTEEQKALVTNDDVLTAAEATLKALEEAAAKAAADQAAADAVIEKIDAIGTVSKDSKAAIKAARAAYDALTADQKALVTNYSTLTAAEETLSALLNPITGDSMNIALYAAVLLVSLMGMAVLLTLKKKSRI